VKNSFFHSELSALWLFCLQLMPLGDHDGVICALLSKSEGLLLSDLDFKARDFSNISPCNN
jgi:hypothetical protein